jgi:hypothetical protein
LDYSNLPTTSAVPDAASMIESFRAIGYSLETAVADLVDNSISAGAKNVWINFNWDGENTWFSIKDDGVGMNNDELVQAMKPGSKNPLEDRHIKDLGRFGLGLKTSSFSQCRMLTVISRRDNHEPVYWTWDLDFVNLNGWKLIKYLPQQLFEDEMLGLKSGTIVVWNKIDRLVKNIKPDDKRALEKFMAEMERMKKHLSMTFHRFIESGKLKIWCWNHLVSAWDPFLSSENATQGFPEEQMQSGMVSVKGYVLPHKSKLSEEKYKEAEGLRGWNEQQGFYVYRNERLLLAGDWLGMYRKEEHYKLARIKVDLTNQLDSEWQIDIKKSKARPPFILRDQLKAYAAKIRVRALEVYRHRGKNVQILPGQKFVPLWIDHKRGDKWFYKINRDHPILENIRKQMQSDPEKAIELLLRFIEETIPTKSIFIKESEEPEAQGKPFDGIDQEPIRKTMSMMFENLITGGKSEMEAKSIILNIEPFNNFPHFLEF